MQSYSYTSIPVNKFKKGNYEYIQHGKLRRIVQLLAVSRVPNVALPRTAHSEKFLAISQTGSLKCLAGLELTISSSRAEKGVEQTNT